MAFINSSNRVSIGVDGLPGFVSSGDRWVPFESSTATGLNGDQADNSAIRADAVHLH